MLRRFLGIVLAALIAFPASAAEVGSRRALLSGGKIAPVWSCNFLTGVFCNGLTYTTSGSIPATLFDSTGKLTYQGNNLLTYSNTFSNGAWNKANTGTGVLPVVTGAYAAGPTGIAGDATRIQLDLGATPASAISRVYQSPAPSGNTINSIWMRTTDGVSTKTLYMSGSGIYSQITVTGAWQQFYFVNTSGNTAYSQSQFGLGGSTYISGGTTSTTADVLVAYATLSAVTYETSPRPQDQVITTSSIYLAPRLDTNPSTLAPAGLLVEEQRVQIAGYNRDLTNAVWTASNITPLKNMTGLDGVANSASRITAGANNGTILQTITLASSQRAQSAYLQRITGSGTVYMTTDGGTTWVDVTSQVGSAGTWARATIAAQTVTNPSFGFKLATSGDAIGVDIVQNEGGAFATSAIPNPTSSTVTRTADVVTFNGVPLAALKSATGSFVAQTQLRANDTSTYQAVLAANDGVNFPVPAYWYTSPKHANAYDGTNFLSAANTLDLTSPQRIATSWSANGRSVVASGGTVASDGYSAFGGYNITVANLGGNNFGTSNIINGWVQSLAIYNARLPDPTLKARSVVNAPY